MNVEAGGVYIYHFIRFVDRESRYIHLKKNQLDSQFIFSIFRQKHLHVSGVSIAHHQEVDRMDTTTGNYCRLGWNPAQPGQQTTPTQPGQKTVI